MSLPPFVQLLTMSMCIVLTAPTSAQHFAMPEDPDLSDGLVAGEPCGTLPRATTSFGSVVHGGWLYVLGGYHGRAHDYDRTGQSPDFYRINLHDLSQMEMLPHSMGIQSCPLEVWNGTILRTGGLVATNAPEDPAHLVSLATVEAYDPATRRWSAMPDMPSGRSSHDTAVIGSNLYVLGGWKLDADTGERMWYEDVWTLDLRHPDRGWSSVPAPFKRRAMASVAVDGRIMVLGGMTPDGSVRRADLFDPTTGSWTELPDFPEQGFGIAADAVNGRVVATGSDGGVHSWRPGASEWRHEGVVTYPRFFHQVAGDQHGDLIVLGGMSGGMRPSQIERVRLETVGESGPVVGYWTVPSPSTAKNRQAFFVRRGWVYMFGGNNSTGQHDFGPDNFLREGYRFNPATMQWRRCADYPMQRQSIQTSMGADGSTGFALGGFGHDGTAARTQREGYTFNFRKNEWNATGPHLPVSRSQFGLVQHGDSYWVFGGLDYDPSRPADDRFRHLSEVMTAGVDGGEDFAEAGVELPRTRRAFGGAVVGDRYFMIGGMTDDFELVVPCDVFDFETRTWHGMTGPARPRLSPEVAVLGNHIFLLGGMSPKQDGSGLESNASLEMYDIVEDTWTTVAESMPIPLRHATMVPFRGQLLIFSSHRDDGNVAQVMLVNPFNSESTEPEEIVRSEF